MSCYLQLHEVVAIVYMGNSYRASLWTSDGERKVLEADGETPTKALENLEKLVGDRTWVEIRRL